MRHYSNDIKETMVTKLCSPGGPSVYQLANETGISHGSLYRWVEKFGGNTGVGKERRPEDWSPEERLQAVFESQGLADEELGEFLRKNGLHSHHIEGWKSEALAEATEKKKPGRPRKDPELVAAEIEIKTLKRELRRKEAALAEQTAIVILQKKAKELWGSDEDDE
jgi:transposase-like protein